MTRSDQPALGASSGMSGGEAAAPGSAFVARQVVRGSRTARLGLRGFALGYLLLLLFVPVLLVFYKAFEGGFANAWQTVTSPEGMHAFYLTVVMVVVAVPLTAGFGVACAIVVVRHRFRGKALLNSMIDLPFAISPVVVGLSLILVYGPRDGWVGPWLAEQGVRVIFTPVGMVIATMFVCLPFVAREVIPVLREIGDEQEQAASTLGANARQTFWRVTLPAIRWGVTYGVVLASARALGEFGAVAVVSGQIVGVTETMPLLVADKYETFNAAGAYAAALVLAALAVITLIAMNLIQRKDVAIVAPSSIAEAAGVGTSTTQEGKETP